jgi:hypothetical protein
MLTFFTMLTFLPWSLFFHRADFFAMLTLISPCALFS